VTNRRATLLALLSAGVGVVIGAMTVGWFLSNFLRYSVVSASAATLTIEGAALNKIHDAEIDSATQLLEINIDGALMTLDASVKEGVKLTPDARAAIGRVKRLRHATGYAPSDPQIRRMVDSALALGEP
jgi:hypothetical protein